MLTLPKLNKRECEKLSVQNKKEIDILIMSTGGTFSSVQTDNGYEAKADYLLKKLH